MPGAASRRFVVIACLLLPSAFVAVASNPVAAQSLSLAGTYDGGQMEMAAGLELKPDGRFNYALAYGALDEEATGTWRVSNGRVLLTSNPVTPPRLVLVSRARAPDGVLQVSLDVPAGLSRQHFDALITDASGQTQKKQLSDDGLLLPFPRGNAPTSIRLIFPVFSVAGDPVSLDPGSGYAVHFRFEPNDVGKVSFRAEPLTIANGDLLFNRHGRTIRFRRKQ